MPHSFDTRPLGPALGAEIIGLDISKPLDDETIAAIAELVEKQTRPQSSVIGDPAWRRSMAGHLTRTALKRLR